MKKGIVNQKIILYNENVSSFANGEKRKYQ